MGYAGGICASAYHDRPRAPYLKISQALSYIRFSSNGFRRMCLLSTALVRPRTLS